MTADQFTRISLKVLATFALLYLVFQLGRCQEQKPKDENYYKIYLDDLSIKVMNPSTGDTIYVEHSDTNSPLIKAIDNDNE